VRSTRRRRRPRSRAAVPSRPAATVQSRPADDAMAAIGHGANSRARVALAPLSCGDKVGGCIVGEGIVLALPASPGNASCRYIGDPLTGSPRRRFATRSVIDSRLRPVTIKDWCKHNSGHDPSRPRVVTAEDPQRCGGVQICAEAHAARSVPSWSGKLHRPVRRSGRPCAEIQTRSLRRWSSDRLGDVAGPARGCSSVIRSTFESGTRGRSARDQ
jgi:hypothetical protein